MEVLLKYKFGLLFRPTRPPSGQFFLYRALVLVNATSMPNFNLLAPLVTEIWRGVPK